MKKSCFLLIAFLAMLCSTSAFAQNKISGKITDTKGEPLVGAAILIKDTTNETVTNTEGVFSLDNVAKGSTLVISFVGYTNKEVSATDNLNISLVAGEALDEVVVTGVFDARKRLEASISISILNSQQISRLAPASAADLLRNVSGVYVNSSLGETRNTVTTRGLSTRAGYNFNLSGLNYVSMQEDGLPVTNIIFNYFTPD